MVLAPKIPNTTTRMSHALTIRMGRRIIGAIHTWSPMQRRTVEEVYEVETSSVGLPVDLVPQTVEGREVRIARYDTYPEIMEEVFGTSELEVLTDQFRPFTIREHWRGPPKLPLGPFGLVGSALGGVSSIAGELGASEVARRAGDAQRAFSDPIAAALSSKVGVAAQTVLGLLDPDIRIYEYEWCYFTDIGRTISASDNRVVSAEATLVWLNRKKVSGR